MNFSRYVRVNATVVEINVMSMNKNRLVFLGMVVSLLAACSTTQTSAPVIDRSSSVSSKPAIDASRSTAVVPKPEGKGYYTVKKGDTLYRIALESGQSYRDIVAWNNLTNPNDIKVDQVLRVAPPEGAQTAAVVTGSAGLEVKPLAPAGATQQGLGSNKTGPRGDKRAYSDSNLAELQKPDNGGVTAQPAAAPSTPRAEPEKSVPVAAVSEDDAVSWGWPADGKVIATFDGAKKGVDIAGKAGQPVLAAAGGKVMYAGSGIRGYGNLVIVKHTNNLLSAYAHNKTILVKEGQVVTKGQKIAEMGNSDTDSVKLHFEVRLQGKPVDPSKYLPPR